MEKEKYLFNASYKYGGSCNGIREFEIDFLKAAIEDKQFFDENWRVINPNDFGDEDVKYILGKMIDLKKDGLLSVTYSNLLIYIQGKFEEGAFNSEYYQDYLETLEHKKLDDERIKEVKNLYLYIGLYNNLIRIGNYSLGKIRDGFLNPQALLNCCDEVIKMCDKVKESKSKMISNNDKIKLKSRYDDEEF